MKNVLLVLLLLVGLASCNPKDPYTNVLNIAPFFESDIFNQQMQIINQRSKIINDLNTSWKKEKITLPKYQERLNTENKRIEAAVQDLNDKREMYQSLLSLGGIKPIPLPPPPPPCGAGHCMELDKIARLIFPIDKVSSVTIKQGETVVAQTGEAAKNASINASIAPLEVLKADAVGKALLILSMETPNGQAQRFQTEVILR